MRRWAARLELAWERLHERPGAGAALLAGALVLAAGLALSQGAVKVPWGQIPAALAGEDHPFHAVLWKVRLPRVLAGALAGAGLAAAGVLTQTLMRNPLADPGLLGVSGGAGTAVVLAVVLAPSWTPALPLLAFGGALGAASLMLATASLGGATASPLKVILSGVALQAIFFAVIALLTFFFADRAPAFVAFTVGSLSAAGWREVSFATVPLLVGLVAGRLLAPSLNLLLLDEASALGIGVEVKRARLGAATLAALLAGSAVAVAGLVGFVGLVVPHWVRAWTGPDLRRLLPAGAAAGALLVIAADVAARVVVAPLELPVGALLALIGGPYFLYLIWRRIP